MDTVPFETCLSLLLISGGKYRGGAEVTGLREWRYEASDSPPVPVAVGSPVWAIKSFETVGQVLFNGREERDARKRERGKTSGLTVEECVEGVVFDFAEFEKVFTRLGTSIDFEIDNDVPEGRFQHD
jgi:hypothetical protein